MNNKKLQEGINALNRIKLLMEYDMSKTLTENIYEQDDEQQDAEDLKKGGKVEVDDYNKKEGYFTILTPDNKGMYVPNGTKILKKATEQDWNVDSWPTTKWYKSRKETAMWLPRDYSDIIKVGSVLRFQTPDNVIYKAEIDNKFLPKNVTWDEFFAAEIKPNDWYFKGYVGSNNKYYESSSPKHSALEDAGHWLSELIKNNWKELVWIIGAVIAGVLTGGLADIALGAAVASESLFTVAGINVSTKALMAYLGEAGVWSAKAVLEDDVESSEVDLIFGFVLPLCHGFWASKLGFGGITESQVNNLAIKIMGKTPEELEALWKLSVEKGGLTKMEKRIFKRAVTIPKEKWSDAMKSIMIQAGKNLESKGINPTSKMQELLWKSSDFVSKTWYKKIALRLPVILAHDLVTIHLIETMLKKFGIENEPEKLNVENLGKIIEKAEKEGKKEEVINNIRKTVKESTNVEDFNKKLSKSYESQFAPIPKTIADTTGMHDAAEELMKKFGGE